MKAIFERVTFGKVPAHPARTGAMRDDRRHPTNVADRMSTRQFAKALKLSHELQHDFLVNVVGLCALRRAVRVETQFEANDAFDDRLGVDCDQLGKKMVNLWSVALVQKPSILRILAF